MDRDTAALVVSCFALIISFYALKASRERVKLHATQVDLAQRDALNTEHASICTAVELLDSVESYIETKSRDADEIPARFPPRNPVAIRQISPSYSSYRLFLQLNTLYDTFDRDNALGQRERVKQLRNDFLVAENQVIEKLTGR